MCATTGMFNAHQCGVFIRSIPTCEAEPRGAVVSRDDGTGSCSHAQATLAPPLYGVIRLTNGLDGSSAGGGCHRNIAPAAAPKPHPRCGIHSLVLAIASSWAPPHSPGRCVELAAPPHSPAQRPRCCCSLSLSRCSTACHLAP